MVKFLYNINFVKYILKYKYILVNYYLNIYNK